MIIIRRLSLAFGVLVGAAASQGPEYLQQYRQRLGGAVDELRAIVARFEADSRASGLSFSDGVARLRASVDVFVQQRGTQMAEIADRKDRLEGQQRDLAQPNPFGRLLAMAETLDPAVAAGAWKAYEPALPTTGEGAAAGLLGLGLGTLLFRLAAAPFRRRVRPGMATPEAPA